MFADWVFTIQIANTHNVNSKGNTHKPSLNKALHFQLGKQTLAENESKLGLKAKEKGTSYRYMTYKAQATTQQCVITSKKTRRTIPNSFLQMSS